MGGASSSSSSSCTPPRELAMFALPLSALVYLALTPEPAELPFPARRETHRRQQQNKRPALPRSANDEDAPTTSSKETFSPSPRRRNRKGAVALSDSSANDHQKHLSPANSRLLGASSTALEGGDASPLASLARSRSRASQQLPPIQPADLSGEAARPWNEYLMLSAEEQNQLPPGGGGGDGGDDGDDVGGADDLNATCGSLGSTVGSLARTANRASSMRNFAAQFLDESNNKNSNNNNSKSPSPEASPPPGHLAAAAAAADSPKPSDPAAAVDHGDDDEEDALEKTATVVSEIEKEIEDLKRKGGK